jgi:drug/metabolite transporter (DMT)-like permease
LHAAVALFGFAALFGQWIALPATAIVLGRTAIAAATLAFVARVRGLPIAPGTAQLAGNGAILAVHWVAFFAAVRMGGVAIALLGYATFPVFVLLLERGAGHARRDYATALLATAGLVAIVPELSWTNDGTRGLVLALVAALTFAWLAIRNRRLVAGGSATNIALWQNLVAAICLVPVVAVDAPRGVPTLQDLAGLAVLGVVCTGVAHTLFIASLRRVPAQAASVVAALEPVYGIALAALFLRAVGEPRRLSVASKQGTVK